MRCSQLTQWVVVVSLTACSSDPPRPTAGFGPGTVGAGGNGPDNEAGGIGTDDDAMAPDDSATGTGGSVAMTDAGADVVDSFVMVPLMHGDATAAMCSSDLATLGSSSLRAGGTTPPSFADAFNAELTKLLTPGPFLAVFSGVNEGSTATKTASFGALNVLAGGVGFAEPAATVPFAIDGARMITIARHDASFRLKFVPPASNANIPVAALEMIGTLASSCTSLTVSALKLLVPATAGAIAFHGSTVGALMGTPTVSVNGGTNNAWPIDLSGKVKEVLTVTPADAGGEDGPS